MGDGQVGLEMRCGAAQDIENTLATRVPRTDSWLGCARPPPLRLEAGYRPHHTAPHLALPRLLRHRGPPLQRVAQRPALPFFFSSRRRHTRYWRDWSSDVCSSDLMSSGKANTTAGRPGPVVFALPEDMLRDEVDVPDRPRVPPLAEEPDPGAIQAMFELLKEAAAPVAIVGGADWSPRAAHHFANFAFRYGIPTVAAFRRQDAICNTCQVYAGNLGYGPNPKVQQRIRDADLILAVGPRLGEATTDGYTLITPDHPGQTLVHVHPDPNELGRVYHADLPICADMGEFSEMLDEWIDPELVRFHAGEEAHKEWLEWSEPQPREGVALDLGPCVKAMRERLPDNTIICNGAGNFSGWWHRYWCYGPMPSQLAPTSGTMGYGLPASVAAALRFRDRAVVCVAGDGDFLMNGQELATAAQYGADLLVLVVDNSSYGTIRMHPEREYPERISATELRNPDFAALARAYGGWAETVERTEDFVPALDRALSQRGIRLLHCRTDVE